MDYPLWNAFLTMMWFFLWFMWIMLLFWILSDIFRSHDLGGWGKAGWVFLVCLLPMIGVLVYLIARGGKMQERQRREAIAQEQDFRDHVREVAGGDSAGQVAALADLRDQGIISESEFQRGKEKVLS